MMKYLKLYVEQFFCVRIRVPPFHFFLSIHVNLLIRIFDVEMSSQPDRHVYRRSRLFLLDALNHFCFVENEIIYR